MSATETATQLQRLRYQTDKAWREFNDSSRRTSQAWDRYYGLAQQLRQAEATRSAEAS